MATLTASAAQANVPALYRENATVTRLVTYNATAALSAGDVVQMVKVPLGAIVTEIGVAVSMSAGAVTVNLGDGNDVSAYAAAAVLSGSVVVALTTPNRGFGRSYSAEDTIDFVVTAVSAAPGTAKLKLKVEYILQNGG